MARDYRVWIRARRRKPSRGRGWRGVFPPLARVIYAKWIGYFNTNN
ncbi:hypothetical protein HMPREF0185_00897 [Brevundimonas diminuta 470-4]|nr:hypothetical protein HMPREF0185_00897 [Brevundimonas diminuta 470-4]